MTEFSVDVTILIVPTHHRQGMQASFGKAVWGKQQHAVQSCHQQLLCSTNTASVSLGTCNNIMQQQRGVAVYGVHSDVLQCGAV